MGKLRVEPKVKAMDPHRYKDLRDLIMEASDLSPDAHVFYDLEPGEDATDLRKDLTYVANKEGLDLKLRRARGTASLKLEFSGRAPAKSSSRIDPEDSRSRILDALAQAGKPMKKSEILDVSGINRGAWNVRIRELIETGKVHRQGERRDTIYTLKK